MSETGFKCPVCGQTAEFTADFVELWGTTRITDDGWDYISDNHDVDITEKTRMTCAACGHDGPANEFLT